MEGNELYSYLSVNKGKWEEKGLTMKMILWLSLLVLTLGWENGVYAQVNEDTLNLINEFQQVNKTRDDEKIRLVFGKLKANPEAIAYMKENMPKIYNAFALRELALRLEDLQTEVGRSTIPQEAGLPQPSRQTGNQAKDTITTTNRNADQPPNRVTIDNAQRALGRPNQEIVESFSNHRRATEFSNQNRLRRLGRRDNR